MNKRLGYGNEVGITVETDDDKLKRLKNLLFGNNPETLNVKLKNSLVRIRRATGKRLKSVAVEKVTEVYTVDKGYFNRDTSSKAYYEQNSQVGEITFWGSRIGLSRFEVKPSYHMHGRRITDIVSKSILRDSAPKTTNKAFYVKLKSGHLGIMERTENSRLPISERVGLSGPEMIGNAKVLSELNAQSEKIFNEETESEIERILNGFGI